MSMSDPVADMLTRIRNGQMANKQSVSFPASVHKNAILEVLVAEGYVDSYSVVDNDKKPVTTVKLRYYQGEPVISLIKRISRPGLRIFRGKNDLPSVMNGLGVAIVSTSKGIMTDRSAREAGEGGEVLCIVE